MRNKRLFPFVLMSLLLIAAFCPAVLAVGVDSTVPIVEIDGHPVSFTSESGFPYLDESGYAMIPLRAVMEAYGCAVHWDCSQNAAIIANNSIIVSVPINYSYIIVNHSTKIIDAPSTIREGKIYLPIQPVMECFGATVTIADHTIAITSPVSSQFKSVYVDNDGNLIFESLNGTTINLGCVVGSNGRNGRDGISVTDVQLTASGNIIVTLSSGRTINAGNISSSATRQTFEDYEVGTIFNLHHPEHEFDIPIIFDNDNYVLHFDSIYYELTGKNDPESDSAWFMRNGMTRYIPYEVTVTIEGETDPALAGLTLYVSLCNVDSMTSYSYSGLIEPDGSFCFCTTQGIDNSSTWYSPALLYFRQASLEE